MQLQDDLVYFCPEKAKDIAVLVIPGGGYRFLSPREGNPVAECFASMGYHAFVATYSVSGDSPLGFAPVKELSQKVAFIRGLALSYGFSKDKIVLCGFSSGGHLAATLGTYWNDEAIFEKREMPLIVPNALVLGYPVISFSQGVHLGSRERLVGDQSELREALSLEKHITVSFPPCFVWGTFTDEKVSAVNGLLLVGELMRCKIPCEYHLFSDGPHGMSLATKEVESFDENLHPDAHIAQWTVLCDEWLQKTL